MFLYYAREKGKLSCKSTGLHLLYDPRGPSVGRVDLPEYDFIKDGKINFGATIRATYKSKRPTDADQFASVKDEPKELRKEVGKEMLFL